MSTAALSLGASCAFAGSGAPAAGAGGTSQTPGGIVAALNAERVANGIPGTVRENPAWSAKCAAHISYMAATGSFGHSEKPSSSAYSTGGSWAGANSVLAAGSNWLGGDPFANAPIHHIQLLSPELRQTGVDEQAGYLCMTTWPGYRPAGRKRPVVYTDPGNGTIGAPYQETAAESPLVPATFIGLPAASRTGYNIMVFVEGMADRWHARITSARLTGPNGAVAVRTVDRTTPTVGLYLPPGSGFLIPVAPLQPGTTYTAAVSFDHGEASSTWRFTTRPAPRPAAGLPRRAHS